MNMYKFLNQVDCTFYFIFNDKSETKTFKNSALEKVGQILAEHMKVSFYNMVSGPNNRHAMSLKSDFQQTIPEQINIAYVDIERGDIILLSQQQRDMLFNEIVSLEEDTDTLPIVQKILDETKEMEEL